MTLAIEPFRHVLVATDFSDPARAALQWAIAIARGGAARISLVHAVHAPKETEISTGIAEEVMRRLGECEQLVEKEGLQVDSSYRAGKPWDVVVDLAGELTPDLIIAGSRGRSAYSRVRLGRTADRIIRAAPAPVLIVRDADDALAGFSGPVLVAIDFSEEADRAMHESLRLVRALPKPPQLVLLHACDYPVEYGVASSAEVIASARAEEAAEAGEALERAAAVLRRAGFTVEVTVREGYAATVIEERAHHLGAGLVALGTQGRSGLAHLMLGSVAERVLHHAACPVLTVSQSVVSSSAACQSASKAWAASSCPDSER